MNDVEGVLHKVLTFHRVALFPRERIESRVDYPFYTMATIEHICHKKSVQLQVEMCSTSTEGGSLLDSDSSCLGNQTNRIASLSNQTINNPIQLLLSKAA
jgi:hypothetical protein